MLTTLATTTSLSNNNNNNSSSSNAANMPNRLTLHAPVMPDTISITVQPEVSSPSPATSPTALLSQPPLLTSILAINNNNNGGVGGLKPCESAPSFGQLTSNASAATLCSDLLMTGANSVNSLLARDELCLQQQRQRQMENGGLSVSDELSEGLGGCGGGGGGGGGGSVGGGGGLHMLGGGAMREESAKSIALQVFFPFLVAGFGMVGAGLLLDTVQHWEVFKHVSEIMVLVPALLGLKGNLEMTLAARLSTQANLGTFDKPSDQLTLIAGNMALIECQAIVVGCMASWFAVLIGFLTDGSFDLSHAFLLCASGIVTAAAASIILGLTMVGVIIVSRRLRINPDNVATPIAASLGDVTSLAILAGVSTLLYGIMDKMLWAGPVIMLACLVTVPILVLTAKKNRYTEEALRSGWLPVISAMVISSFAGFIFDTAVSRYQNIAVFQPVINGVGGNLVAIHASRISTSLHKCSEQGHLPSSHSKVCVGPCTTFFGKDIHTSTARVLLALVLPGHLIFAYIICYVKTGEASLTFSFVAVYLTTAFVQVALLLYISLVWTHWMWRRNLDPDTCSIPYLTAFGDLFGIGLLTLGFLFLTLINEDDIGVGY